MERKIKDKSQLSLFSIEEDDSSNSSTGRLLYYSSSSYSSDTEDYDDEETDDEVACNCDHQKLFEAAQLVVGIKYLEKKISSSRWKDVKNDSEEAKEAAEDLREIILKSSSSLYQIFNQTGIEEEIWILRLIRLCVKFRVYDEVLDFLKDLMLYRHSWSKTKKFSFLRHLISSPDVWGKLDSTSRQTFINICGSLINSWTKEILDIRNSINGRRVRKGVFTCVKMFLLVDINRRQTEQFMAIQELDELIGNLNFDHLVDLVLELHELEPMIRPNIEMSSVNFNSYRELCRRIFSEISFDPFSVNQIPARRILNWLLWIDDEETWKAFNSNISNNFPKSFGFLEDLLVTIQGQDIERAIADSPKALDCFNRIADSLAKSLESLVEPIISWCQPKAVVPNHPVVEAFLRSSQESMGYLNFTNIAEARIFAYYLENRENVSVSLSGCGKKSKCFIRKINEDFERRKLYAKQLAKAREFVNRITRKKRPKKQTVVPPAKLPKLDTRFYQP